MLRRAHVALALGLAMLLTSLAPARGLVTERRDREARHDPQQIAARWFRAVAEADIEQALSLSALPFWWNAERSVEGRGDLEALYRDVARRRGRRELAPDRVETFDPGPELARYCGEGRRGDVLRFWIGDDNVGVCVAGGRVIGFRD